MSAELPNCDSPRCLPRSARLDSYHTKSANTSSSTTTSLPSMFTTTALAAFIGFFSLQSTEALTLHARQSDGGAGLTSPGAVGFDYPPIRGWSLDAAKKPICGGFELHARTDFPSSTSKTLAMHCIQNMCRSSFAHFSISWWAIGTRSAARWVRCSAVVLIGS